MTAPVRARLLAAAILFAVALAGGVAGAQAIDTDEESLFGSSGESDDGAKESSDAADLIGTPGGDGDDAGDAGESLLDTSGLFEGDVLVTEPEDAADAPAVPAAPPPVEIGGSYRFSLTGEAHWASLTDLAGEPLAPDSHRAAVDLGATVFLDARPATTSGCSARCT